MLLFLELLMKLLMKLGLLLGYFSNKNFNESRRGKVIFNGIQFEFGSGRFGRQ